MAVPYRDEIEKLLSDAPVQMNVTIEERNRQQAQYVFEQLEQHYPELSNGDKEKILSDLHSYKAYVGKKEGDETIRRPVRDFQLPHQTQQRRIK